MPHNAKDIIKEASTEKEKSQKYLRGAADWFHEREGDMLKRKEAKEKLQEEFDIDSSTAHSVIAQLVGDTVDPIIQVPMKGTKYVGVVEYREFDGAYGYIDFDDARGQRKRVVCAQCVHEAEYDTEVVHATAGDPEGSYSPDTGYEELLEGVHDHYRNSHDVMPERVETGASLVSGTTIGGNEAWHTGNDGGGSGLNADTLDGDHASEVGRSDENIASIASLFPDF